jgi:YesN/AraC family two-component response regulator
MPKMNGLDFIREIKKTIQNQNIPIIINSGYLNREILQFANHHGIKDILVKPFNEEIFIDKFCYALGLHLL